MYGLSSAQQVKPRSDGEDARWSLICRILHSALQLRPEQRIDYLDQACGVDVSMRSEVEELLSVSERSAAIDHPLNPDFLNVLRNEMSESTDSTLINVGAGLSHYKIIGKIGEGGMGSVFKAIDIRLGRFAAIKVISSPRVTDHDKHRFAREARAASALNHPHIITIYEYGSDRDIDFIAME